MNKPRTALIGAGIALFVLVVLAVPLLRLWENVSPLPAAVLEDARAGVRENTDWQPVFRKLDGLDLVLVPAGCFTMGSTEAQLLEAVDSCERYFGPGRCKVDFAVSETPAHEVCFSDPFWIGETEVTNRQYGSNSSTDMVNMYRGPDWPRETVTWDEAAQYCQAHNARLPSEAEWEYAARGPSNLIYPWGNEYDLAKVISGRLNPQDVASTPGGVSWVGAFDLSGSVEEWVADWYAPYAPGSVTDPQSPAAGETRVLRGGDWYSYAGFFVRTTQRDSATPDTANSTIGFRCARDVD